MTTTINNNQKITLLNPFSVLLKKPPFMDINTAPVYKNGDYRIYKLYDKHFVHTYKNIVICERCAANTELINNLINDTKPSGEADFYFLYERPKQAISEGIEAAKKLNFLIK